MNGHFLARTALAAAALLLSAQVEATRFKGMQVIDNETLLLQFQDGDVRYRDDGTGESAYLGHTFVEGDDTLVVFQPRFRMVDASKTMGSAKSRSFPSICSVSSARGIEISGSCRISA